MPFASEKQRRYMWAKHPAIARRWSQKYGDDIKRKSPRPSEEEMDKERMRKKRQRTGLLPPYRHEPMGKTSTKRTYKA